VERTPRVRGTHLLEGRLCHGVTCP